MSANGNWYTPQNHQGRNICRAILGFKADARELDLTPADLAVLSPGIPPNSALAETCRKLATDVIGEFEFGARQLSCPILAILGQRYG